MNNISIIGNLVRDPQLYTTQKGDNVCRFTVAVNKRDGADYFSVTVFGARADSCQKYLSKGSKVGVTGSVSLNEYVDKNGKNHGSIAISANGVDFLKGSAENGNKAPSEANNDIPEGYEEVTDEELPF